MNTKLIAVSMVALLAFSGAMTIASMTDDSVEETDYMALGAIDKDVHRYYTVGDSFSFTVNPSHGFLNAQNVILSKPSWISGTKHSNTSFSFSGTAMNEGDYKIVIGWNTGNTGERMVIWVHVLPLGVLPGEPEEEGDPVIVIPSEWDHLLGIFLTAEFWILVGGGFLLVCYVIGVMRSRGMKR